MAEQRRPLVFRAVFLAVIAVLTVLSVVLAPAPSRAGEDITGEWLIGFESDPLTSGDLTLTFEDVCLASLLEEGSSIALFMSCDELGVVELSGTLDANGTFRLVGSIEHSTKVPPGTTLTMVQTVTDSVLPLTGTWTMALDPELEGSFAGDRSKGIRGLVRCVRVNVGPFGARRQAESADATLILQYDAGLVIDLPCLYLGDVNIDGVVDSIDAMLLLQRLAGIINRYPPY